MPKVEACVIRPQDFVKVINHLRSVIAGSEPRKRTLPYERAVRDLAIIRFVYATGCPAGEVALLRLRDLDLDNQTATIQLHPSKSKQKREGLFWPPGALFSGNMVGNSL